MPTVREHTPPADLDERWKKLWRRTYRLLVDHGVWHPGRLDALADYVTACRLADEHATEADDDGRYSTNEDGRAFAHPGIRLAADRRAEARALRIELGLHLCGEDPDPPTGGEDDDRLADQAGL